MGGGEGGKFVACEEARGFVPKKWEGAPRSGQEQLTCQSDGGVEMRRK